MSTRGKSATTQGWFEGFQKRNFDVNGTLIFGRVGGNADGCGSTLQRVIPSVGPHAAPRLKKRNQVSS